MMKKFEEAKLTLIRIDGDVLTTSLTTDGEVGSNTDTGD